MRRPRFGDDVAGRHPGVQRGVRVLEHHLHPAAPRQQLLALERERIDAVEADGALVGAFEHQQRARQSGLAAAGFADQAEGFAAAAGQVDAVQRARAGARWPCQRRGTSCVRPRELPAVVLIDMGRDLLREVAGADVAVRRRRISSGRALAGAADVLHERAAGLVDASGGMACSSGGVPGIDFSSLAAHGVARARIPAGPWCRGAAGDREDLDDRPGFDHVAART